MMNSEEDVSMQRQKSNDYKYTAWEYVTQMLVRLFKIEETFYERNINQKLPLQILPVGGWKEGDKNVLNVLPIMRRQEKMRKKEGESYFKDFILWGESIKQKRVGIRT